MIRPRFARGRRWFVAAPLIFSLALGALPGPAGAHGPDPLLSGALWAQNQALTYSWRSGQVPPAWLQSPVNAAASDIALSRASKSATMAYRAGSTSWVSYDEPSGCGAGGLACFTRSAPNSFTMSFRRNGYVFDWGTLKWCQAYSSAPYGCFDAENIALDEFGHVEILWHHVNNSGDPDYRDAVVQTVSRAYPQDGWNAHSLARCDIATLQTKYDVATWATPYSTCLSLASAMTLAASATTISRNASVTFTAVLKVASNASYERLSANPLSSRVVQLQRRPPGATSWSTVGTMAAQSTAGTYLYSIALTGTYEWRAIFSKPANEGVAGTTSGSVMVTVR